jgi:hypothetical protein
MFSLRAIFLVRLCERRRDQYRTNVWRSGSSNLFGDIVSIDAMIPLIYSHSTLSQWSQAIAVGTAVWVAGGSKEEYTSSVVQSVNR